MLAATAAITATSRAPPKAYTRETLRRAVAAATSPLPLTLQRLARVGTPCVSSRYPGQMHDKVTRIDVSATDGSGTMEFSPLGVGAHTAHPPLRPHIKLLHGMREPDNWLQLIRFGIVGGAGFAINLLLYAAFVRGIGVEYLAAEAAAWILSGANNFVWNRHWTFRARDGEIHLQAIRFLLVSLVALGIDEGVLRALVETGGLDKVVAQVLALGLATPFNFLGNKLWSFRVQG